ncbi:MAG TPA: flagellar basal body rod protein FlgC [Gammaproteobacteria bacterium]|nr:flagellar basal body rod protein FlgC [Gammaproteobacteria bacterium]
MGLGKVFDIAGTALSAQSIRLNTVASNMANANSISSTPNGVYRSRQPVFSAIMDNSLSGDNTSVGVRVVDIVEKQGDVNKVFDPGNPRADASGFVYQSNVNIIEEMTNMISASRSYQNNIEVMNTAKQLMLATLRLGE